MEIQKNDDKDMLLESKESSQISEDLLIKRAKALSSMLSHSEYQLTVGTDEHKLVDGRSETVAPPSQLYISQSSRGQNNVYQKQDAFDPKKAN